MDPIITSLLDNDLYKFTMQQAVLHHFPEVDVEYTFKCRTEKADFSPYLQEIKSEIDHLCKLHFTLEELAYLQNLKFIKKDYIDFLQLFHLNREHIHIQLNNDQLEIRIKGSWVLTILFEVPVLAIINEIYFRHQSENVDLDGAMVRLEQKIELSAQMGSKYKFADFGTRRRFSKLWHQKVIQTLAQSKIRDSNFVGTSNVLYAKMFQVKPIGTMAHEWLQAGQAVGVRLVDSQKFMLQKWVDEYRGDLGIALSDVITLEAFLHDFDLYFSKLYDGIRIDSGDPFSACEKIITHYKSMNIDPWTKSVVFSDGLDFETAQKLVNRFKGRIRVSFGIGTNLTNDIPQMNPIQIVIKMVKCNDQPVAKITDTPRKGIGEDNEYIKYLIHVFEAEMGKKINT